MKKILLYASLSALLALCACEEQPKPTPSPVVVEEVKLSPSTLNFTIEGGTADVMVSCTGAWTLSGEYDWVRASALSGVDGDIVSFSADPNEGTESRQARFTFSVSESVSAELVVSEEGVVIPERTFTLLSEPSLNLGYEKGRIEVRLQASDNTYREFKYSIDESAASWLSYDVTLVGENDNEGKMYFSYSALDGLDDRLGGITFSVDGVDQPVRVELTQYARHVLYLNQNFYSLATAGETITIPVHANVEFEVSVQEGDGWLTRGQAGENGIPFTATALESGKRQATVTFTQTDAADGETPLSTTATLTQQAVVIEWAANMKGNRLYPKWTGSGLATNMTEFTLETMLYVNNFKTNSGDISTVMGVEGEFLLRFGDVGVPANHLQVACKNSIKFEIPFDFQTNTWYHLAVSFGEDTLKVYVDGDLKLENAVKSEGGYTQKYTLCTDWQQCCMFWSLGRDKAAFMAGYSYTPGRDLDGRLTEIRFWSKCLSKETINSAGHFYSVDAPQDGLMAYWKFNAGSGGEIADLSGNGYTLYGEVGTTTSKPSDTCSIDWVSVSLPDK